MAIVTVVLIWERLLQGVEDLDLGLPLRHLRVIFLWDSSSWGLNWQLDLTDVCQARDSESESVRLDVLDRVVLLDLVRLPTSGAGGISTGASGLDARGCVAVGKIHWLGLSLSGNEVRVCLRLCGDTWCQCVWGGCLRKLGDEGGHQP